MISGDCEGLMKKSGHVDGMTSGEEEAGCVRAVAMYSGGLDSLLAALVVRHAGIDVTLLHVKHLFSAGESGCRWLAETADRYGFALRIEDASGDHLTTIRHPKHGYGKGMNPCVDCRVFMLTVARRVMNEISAQFVVTGEVLGQRPKSQQYRALLQAAEESGLGDRLLRPLSANLLPETVPVRQGWLKPEDLYSIHGRSREQQTRLAEAFGVDDYPQPAGGCLLTEKVYAARVRDAFDTLGKDEVGVDEFRLLRIGRHFRLSPTAKAIIGRDEAENDQLVDLAGDRLRLEPVDVMGPMTLVEGQPTGEEIRLVAALAARYCDAEEGNDVAFRVFGGSPTKILATPLSPDDPRIGQWRIGNSH